MCIEKMGEKKKGWVEAGWRLSSILSLNMLFMHLLINANLEQIFCEMGFF